METVLPGQEILSHEWQRQDVVGRPMGEACDSSAILKARSESIDDLECEPSFCLGA